MYKNQKQKYLNKKKQGTNLKTNTISIQPPFMGFQKDKVLLYNMKPLMISLFILFITLLLALMMYLYMPTQCKGKVKEALTNEETELPYYKMSSTPSSTEDYAYINGIYCYPGDDECREYALTCTVGKDPNCHNNKPSDANCYDASGAYICGGVKPSTATLNYSCQTISGEYICNGNLWGTNNVYPQEISSVTDVCKVENGSIICNESVWKNIYLRDMYDEENTVNTTGWVDQTEQLNEWGIRTATPKQSWYNFDYNVQDTPLLNYPLQKSDWNRYLTSPAVDTKEDSVNTSTLNKIYQQLYVLASRNDCSMGVYGCCSDKKTAKVDFQGSNCPTDAGLTEEVKKYIELTVTKSASQLTPPPGSSIANAAAVPPAGTVANVPPAGTVANVPQPPPGSSIANAEAVPPPTPSPTPNNNVLALSRQPSAVPPSFSMSSAPTDSAPQHPTAQAEPISGSTGPANPTAFATNVLPTQTSYTNTVFLTGPRGNLIGNGPDPSFECKKGNCQQNSLPMPLLADFSSFV